MPDEAGPSWTFVTNHALVLVVLARTPEVRLRDVAEQVGITERAVQRILGDLVEGGYVTRERVGRRNRYEVHPGARMRHPIAAAHEVGELLGILTGEPYR